MRVWIDMTASAKYRNVGVNPNVAFVVDDAVSEGAAGMRFLEVRGVADRVSVEPPPAVGLSPQIIRIHPRRVISWNVDPDHPGLQAQDLATVPDEPEASRPSFGTDDAAEQRAIEAVTHLVDELQAGWDQHDADISNRHFAYDIVWGSPFGATLQGYEQLHAIHTRLKQQARGGESSLRDREDPRPCAERRRGTGPTGRAQRRRPPNRTNLRPYGCVLGDGALCADTPRSDVVACLRAEHAPSPPTRLIGRFRRGVRCGQGRRPGMHVASKSSADWPGEASEP